jgi:hypothetical protein
MAHPASDQGARKAKFKVQLRNDISEKLRRIVVSTLLLAQLALLLAAAVHQHADLQIAGPSPLRISPVECQLVPASESEPLCVTCRVIRQCLAQISGGNSVPHVLTRSRLKLAVAAYHLHPVPRFFVCPRAPPSFS